MRSNKSYSELITLLTFEERFNYLKLSGQAGIFQHTISRHVGQPFYMSKMWLQIRDGIIVRDNGCLLGLPNMFIYDKIVIHHINPISNNDIMYNSPALYDPENLICCNDFIHKKIHYGDLPNDYIYTPRTPNDHCPWK